MSCQSFFALSLGLAVRDAVAIALALGLAGLHAPLRPARAAEPAKYGNALYWAPADAAFFAARLRNKEQVDLIVNSKAWKKLSSLASFQQFWQQMQMAFTLPGSPFAELQQALQDPANRQLLDLAGDLASHEVVYYGDIHAVEVWELGSRAYNAARYSMIAPNFGAADLSDFSAAMMAAPLRVLAAHLDEIETPTIVVGFKCTRVAALRGQLDRLEKLLAPQFEAAAQLKGRFERKKVDGSDYLVLKLDGQLIPWNQMPPLKRIERTPGEFDKLIDKLKHLPLVVAIGVRGDYLLVSIGPSTDHLAGLSGGKRLIDRPECQPLTKFADRRLTRIEYTSPECRLAQALDLGGNPMVFYAGNIEGLFDAVRSGSTRMHVSKEVQAGIDRHLDDLKKALIAARGNGAACGVTFLTPQGTESYDYDWSTNSPLDGSKPLDLLAHVGGSPLVAIVSRSKNWAERYRQAVATAAAVQEGFEALALPQMSPDCAARIPRFHGVRQAADGRLDTATTALLLPGLADGQAGLVLDAKLSSDQLTKKMPRSTAPLPVPEPAIIVGVSDADLVKKARSNTARWPRRCSRS